MQDIIKGRPGLIDALTGVVDSGLTVKPPWNSVKTG